MDAGCGEGYYLRRLRRLLATDDSVEGTVVCGLDISKHGIRVAARRDPQGLYAVAGTYRVPILPARVDVLLTHFSPISPADFRRVVKPGGVVLVGGPGHRHLFSFKKLLYESPTEHESMAATLAEERGFELIDTHVIRYPMSLRGRGQVANLLLMTPFFWSVDDDTRVARGARCVGHRGRCGRARLPAGRVPCRRVGGVVRILVDGRIRDADWVGRYTRSVVAGVRKHVPA